MSFHKTVAHFYLSYFLTIPVNVKVHGVMVPASTLRLTSTTAEAAATFARTGSSVPATNGILVSRLLSQ